MLKKWLIICRIIVISIQIFSLINKPFKFEIGYGCDTPT